MVTFVFCVAKWKKFGLKRWTAGGNYPSLCHFLAVLRLFSKPRRALSRASGIRDDQQQIREVGKVGLPVCSVARHNLSMPYKKIR